MHRPHVPRASRRAVALVAASATAVTASALLLGPVSGTASSHREAPLIANDPAADNTDVYAFVSPDQPDTVTLVGAWLPFENPTGGPNFYPFDTTARYEFHIDNNGDAKADFTYRYTFQTQDKRGTDTFLYNNGPVNSFDDETLLFKQTYKLELIAGGAEPVTVIEDAKVAPSHVGAASMPNYATLRDEAITTLPEAGRSFAGQADDPFFVDLRVFDLLFGGDLSEVGQNVTDGFNVNAIALQVPTATLVQGDDPVIGVWSTTSRPSMTIRNADGTQSTEGDFVQVSRLGAPLVNEVVVPAGLKDAFNALTPDKDASVQPVVDRVNDPEVPKLIEKIYKLEAPKTPRDDLFAVFLTGVEGLNKPKGEVTPAEMLRLNTSIEPSSDPNRLGVLAKDNAGFPNGRRLADDVVDIELQALEGAVRTGKLVEALAKGDAVDSNDKEFGDSFPYVALPHSGSGVSAGGFQESGDSGGSTGSGSSGSGSSGGSSSSGGGTPSGGVSTGAGGTAARSGSAPVLPTTAALLGVVVAGFGVMSLRRRRSSQQL